MNNSDDKKQKATDLLEINQIVKTGSPMVDDSNLLMKLRSLDPEVRDEFAIYTRLKNTPNDKNFRIGASRIFINTFIAFGEMTEDMPAIICDFLKHYSPRLAELAGKVDFVDDASMHEYGPKMYFYQRILATIYQAAIDGDAYCRGLMRHLYKSFYRSEYKELKRYSSLSAEDVFSFTDEYGEEQVLAISRIVCMAPLLDITMDESCKVLHEYIREEHNNGEWVDEYDELLKFSRLEDEISICSEIVDGWAWISDDNYKTICKSYNCCEIFQDAVFGVYGLGGNNIKALDEKLYDVRSRLILTLAVLRKVFPNKEWTFEEVQQYAYLYWCMDIIASLQRNYETSVDMLLGLSSYDPSPDSRFRPDSIINEMPIHQSKSQPVRIQSKHETKESSEDEIDSLKEEIEDLKQRLHVEKSKTKQLHDTLTKTLEEKVEQDAKIITLSNNRDELKALRDFAYRCSQKTENVPNEISLEEMAKALKGKHICIIGGNINWLNKLNQLCPDWKYINQNSYRNVSSGMLNGMEKVYFFTDCMSHALYYKFISEIRSKRIPFDYIANINLNSVISTVYNDMIGQ